MLIAVHVTRGPSPIHVDVQTDDEDTARRVAYRWAYYGDTKADDSDSESPVTGGEIEEYTAVVRPVRSLTPE
jgi:hypothetical protein